MSKSRRHESYTLTEGIAYTQDGSLLLQIFRWISNRVWGSNFDLRSRRQSAVQFPGWHAASQLHT